MWSAVNNIKSSTSKTLDSTIFSPSVRHEHFRTIRSRPRLHWKRICGTRSRTELRSASALRSSVRERASYGVVVQSEVAAKQVKTKSTNFTFRKQVFFLCICHHNIERIETTLPYKRALTKRKKCIFRK